jgi:PadR family transcriptional regulator, regulatory protein PadR
MQDELPNQIDAWQRQLRKGVLELAVLGLLRRRPRYGLEIVERLSPLGVASGTIYPLLARIQREGKVESRWVSDRAPHPRKYYSLTEAGRRTCEAQLDAWRAFSAAFAAVVEGDDAGSTAEASGA